jgi:ADP-ribosylglycohydrolase
MLAKIYGCLAGLAIGDALGMPTEFLSPEEIAQQYGWVNRFVPASAHHPHAGMRAGQVTDDTGQALAIAHACRPDGMVTAESAARHLIAWEDSLPEELLAVIEGPSTRAALRIIRAGRSPSESGVAGSTNGAAMRVAAAGLLHPGDLEAAGRAAVEASLPTHGTRPGLSGAVCVACAVSAAVEDGATLETILRAAKLGAEMGACQGQWMWSTPLAGRIELAELLVNRANGDASVLRALFDFVGVSMLVSESVAAAMGIVLLAGGDPMKAVQLSANIGGDTDTIGAIAGQICGAWRGMDAIDERMVKVVEDVNHLHLWEESRQIEDMLQRRKRLGSG